MKDIKGTKCAPPQDVQYRSWVGRYYRKEEHISKPLRKVLKDIYNKHIKNVTEEETF